MPKHPFRSQRPQAGPTPEEDPFAGVQPDLKTQLADADQRATLRNPAPEGDARAVTASLLAALETHFGPLEAYGPLEPQPPVTGATIRAACRWCRGRGCLVCDGAAEAEYRRQFPHGPQPLATFDPQKPEDMAALKALMARLLEGGTP